MSPTGWKALARYGSVGFELSAMILLGFFFGRWLDRHFGWHAVGTIGGVLLGVYSGFRMLFKRAKEAERQMELDDARELRAADEEAKLDRFRHDAKKADEADEAASSSTEGK